LGFEAVYRFTSPKLNEAAEKLSNYASLVMQEPDVVAAALERFRCKPALSFSDCLMVELARKAGHLPLGTFDRTLAGVEGVQKL
jgi:predicted nucleic acid-binding protein